MQPLESYSLFDPEIAENPFAYYAELRKRAPVYKMPIGMWIVSSHALCLQAMRDVETFSSRFIQGMGLPGTEATARRHRRGGARRTVDACSRTTRRRIRTSGSS